MNNESMKTVIIGSFRKHLKEIASLKELLENYNIQVLSPIDMDVVDPNDEFIVFKSDLVSDPKILQDSVFSKIRHSTFIIVANVGGYLGHATLMEIGYTIAQGIEIYTLEPVHGPHLTPYCKPLSHLSARILPMLKKENFVYI